MRIECACADACTHKAIVAGTPYAILGERCDECGNCYHVRPVGAFVSSARAFRKIRRQPWEENQKRAEKLQPPFRAHHTPRASKTSRTLPHGDIVSLMERTLGAANRYLVELMAREGSAGIVSSHGDILMQSFAHDAMSMAALAEAIGKDPSTVTALVRKLANAGYVEKAPNPRDCCVCEVRLTDAGRALESAMDRVSHTLITTLTIASPPPTLPLLAVP